MKNPNDVERILLETPLPCVVDGPHRQRLKSDLLARLARGEVGCGKWRSLVTRRPVKAAAAALVCLLLVAGGWAAERVYEEVRTWFFVDIQPSPPQVLSVSFDGKEGCVLVGTVAGMMTISDAPGLTQEAAQRKWEEVKALIARRQYEFVKAFPSSDGQTQQYVYRFRLADGEPFSTNFDCRLEEVNSWEEYEARVARQRQERFAAIENAIAQGRFRLLDVDILLSHICLDPASGRKLIVRRIPMPDKTVIALITTYPSSEAKGGTETSWQDHLRTIAEGKRVLLDIESARQYKYEVTLHDGSTTLFNYGGDKPLPAQGNSVSPAAR